MPQGQGLSKFGGRGSGEGQGTSNEGRGAGVLESLADRFGGNFSRLGEGQPRLRDGRGETVIGVAA